MHIQLHTLVFGLGFFLSSGWPALGQTLPIEMQREILKAQDLRDATGMIRFLGDSLPAMRANAALAAGSVQDTAHIPFLLTLLNDPVSAVRKAAAFALGQMNPVVDSATRGVITGSLLRQLRADTDHGVQVRLIGALGKTGAGESLDEVAATASRMRDAGTRGEIALAIGRYAYRNIRSAAGTRAAVAVLDIPGEEWKAAYALMRVGESGLLREHTARIVAAARHADPQVRMLVATVLGKLSHESSARAQLADLAGADPDWRVRVNAVKSLAGVDLTPDPRVGTELMSALSDANEHVSLAALASMVGVKVKGSAIEGQVRTVLTSILDGAFTPRQKREAAIALAKTFGRDAYPVIAAAGSKGGLLRTDYINALGHVPSSDAQAELLSYSRQADPEVQRAALDAILTSCALAPPSLEMIIAARSSFVRALASGDMAVITTASGGLADSLLADSTVILPLLEALNRMKAPDDVEPMTAVIQALGSLKADAAISTLISTMNDSDRTIALEAALALENITGNRYRQFVAPHSPPSHTNFDWALLDRVRERPDIVVSTSRGSFTITMFPDEAPFTCLNVASLVNKGFYNGLVFHRVVPNFVVQGGDPRGDGWGGPGYAIRSEFGYSHYDRGMVGMASSGKDTEGSQFFVTHSRQPHLDGRYTIFGRVTSGMDIVDKIQVGDVMTRVAFANGASPGGGE